MFMSSEKSCWDHTEDPQRFIYTSLVLEGNALSSRGKRVRPPLLVRTTWIRQKICGRDLFYLAYLDATWELCYCLTLFSWVGRAGIQWLTCCSWPWVWNLAKVTLLPCVYCHPVNIEQNINKTNIYKSNTDEQLLKGMKRAHFLTDISFLLTCLHQSQTKGK